MTWTKEKQKEYNKKYKEENKEKNKEKNKEYNKKYRQDNKDKINERNRKSEKEKREKGIFGDMFFICEYCEKQFKHYKRRKEKSKNIFCSKKCHYNFKEKRSIKLICGVCNNKFSINT